MKSTPSTVLLLASLALPAAAHDGRRFEIQNMGNQLWAQGYLSGADPVNDGGGLIRPYFNAIHGHWTNNPSPAVTAASSTLPGFDLFLGGDLTGFDLTLTLEGARKWVSPPPMPTAETVVDFTALEANEEVFVGFGGEFVSTATPGTLTLIESVTAGGLLDIDLTYDIAAEPTAVLFVLDFTLSTSNPDIASSEIISVILSPDGTGPIERLHHASLFLESKLGVVPAPSTGALLLASGLFAGRRRRQA